MTKKCALELKNLYFRYEKDSPDILKGLSAKIYEGEHYAILGANGAGKSTLFKRYFGRIYSVFGEKLTFWTAKIAYLPQKVKMLFEKNTSADDLREAVQKDSENFEKRLENVIEICGLENLTDRHPYDLSGGEQERAAIAKILLTEPDILLLDEPTKGIDAHFKQKLARLIKTLQKSGITVVTVSHDIEFCAEYADRCAMFFDGQIVSEGAPREFFSTARIFTLPRQTECHGK
ncbi:MAG: energy-coupling factor ABC transporter ATP-binding protein [Clostridiales bacterium]|nr:MAG: energy-coupling factor ABC transporter ATP-binding protein [Clostridiales bacterium]